MFKLTPLSLPPSPQAPSPVTWSNGKAAVDAALTLEKLVNGKLLDLHWTAQQVNDPDVSKCNSSIGVPTIGLESFDGIRQPGGNPLCDATAFDGFRRP